MPIEAKSADGPCRVCLGTGKAWTVVYPPKLGIGPDDWQVLLPSSGVWVLVDCPVRHRSVAET